MTAPATTVERHAWTAAPGPLGNEAKSAATAGQDHSRADASLREKWAARRDLAALTTVKRVRSCGHNSMRESGAVDLLYTAAEAGAEASAGYGGLVTCGSVWVCPVCSAKIAAQRTAELTRLIEWNDARGGTSALLTLTMRHHAGHRLDELWDGISAAWRHLTGSRSWKDAKTAMGLDYVRATEITHGRNGWHVHLHVLLVFPPDGATWERTRVRKQGGERVEVHESGTYRVDGAGIVALAANVQRRWIDGLGKRGFTASTARGIDLQWNEHATGGMANYLNKLAFEAAGSRFKKGRQGGRTPFELLADVLRDGTDRDRALWEEWERASHGRRMLVWSNGLKAKVGVDEITDDEIAEQDNGGNLVAKLPRRTWAAIRPHAEELLIVCRTDGPDAARRWLDDHGLAWHLDDPDEGPEWERVTPPVTEEPFAWLRETLAEERRAARAARQGCS